MVLGLDPMEAVDRLKKFQQLFDVRKRKWVNYSSGEELFGLTVTEYPELEKTEKEIQMLDRLYSLFVNVITTINGCVRLPPRPPAWRSDGRPPPSFGRRAGFPSGGVGGGVWSVVCGALAARLRHGSPGQDQDG